MVRVQSPDHTDNVRYKKLTDNSFVPVVAVVEYKTGLESAHSWG